jgi:hypothetical protein
MCTLHGLLFTHASCVCVHVQCYVCMEKNTFVRIVYVYVCMYARYSGMCERINVCYYMNICMSVYACMYV